MKEEVESDCNITVHSWLKGLFSAQKRDVPVVITVKPSVEDQIKLAELYDEWNSLKTMTTKVKFMTYARNVIHQSPQNKEIGEGWRFDYDLTNGYLDLTLKKGFDRTPKIG